MNKNVIMIENNLIYIKNILSVKKATDDYFEFETEQGNIEIEGANLEIMMYNMFSKIMLVSGYIQSINN